VSSGETENRELNCEWINKTVILPKPRKSARKTSASALKISGFHKKTPKSPRIAIFMQISLVYLSAHFVLPQRPFHIKYTKNRPKNPQKTLISGNFPPEGPEWGAGFVIDGILLVQVLYILLRKKSSNSCQFA